MKSSVIDFFSKKKQICRKLQIFKKFLKKSLLENVLLCII